MRLFYFHLILAIQSLKHNKSYALTVVTTLGLTLGALICALTLTYVMVYKPLPYPNQAQLTYIEHQLIDNEGKVDGRAFTYPNLMHLYKHHNVFSNTALQYFDGDIITSESSKPRVEISFVTPEWFELFDMKLHLGRGFEQTERLNTYNPVAVISYQTWQNTFEGRADILGHSISFSGKTYEIIGVLEKDSIELNVAAPGIHTKIFVPWDFNSIPDSERVRWGNDDGSLMFVGQLPSTYNMAQVSQQLTNLISENWQQQVSNASFFTDWSINIVATPLSSVIVADSENQLFLLLFGTLGLAVIAIANIANLYMARTAQQQHTLAVNAAVGAPRSGILSLALADAVILLGLSLIVSIVIAHYGFSLATHYLANFLPRASELGLNPFTLVSSLAILLLLLAFFALLNVKMTNYRQLISSLKSSGKGTKVQVSSKLRFTLITSQIAIASFLIFANTLLFSDAYSVMTKPLGYETDNIHALVLSQPQGSREEKAVQMQSLIKAIEAEPNVLGVSQSIRPSGFFTLAIAEQESGRRYSVRGKGVDEHYFAMIGQPLLAGENFTNTMREDENPGIIVNEHLARKMSPEGNALGITMQGGAKVIGIVKSIIVPGKTAPEPRFYYLSRASRNMLLIKTVNNQPLSRDTIVSLADNINKQLNLFSYRPTEYYKASRLFTTKTTAVTTLVLIFITLLLCSIGLYGILKYSSEMRRAEIGTRMAVGAKRKDILKLICVENLTPLAAGIGLNAMALGIIYVVSGQLVSNYQSTQLAWSFTSSIVTVTFIGFIASYLPLKRYFVHPTIYCLRGEE